MRWLTVICIVSVTAALAQPNEKQVGKLFYKKIEWMKNHQYDSLAAMLDDRLMYIHSNGWVESKQDVIDNLKTGKLVYRNVDVTEITTRLYAGVAIVTGKGIFTGVMNGAEFGISLLFTEVYVKSGKKWLLASRHANRLP